MAVLPGLFRTRLSPSDLKILYNPCALNGPRYIGLEFQRGEALAAKANRAKSKSRSKPAPAKKPVVRRKKLKIAIAGFGTVGRSVAKLLCQEASDTFELTHIFNRDVARKK